MNHTPPFTISSDAINLIAEITAHIERYAIRLEQADGVLLRKVNRIKSIHSSLAIEGNTLTEQEVSDIVNGKMVVAPIREIQEVKNAVQTYELYEQLNPFDEKDLLRAHGTMMSGLAEDAGKFRHCQEGVFDGDRCIQLAPPPDRVPVLMEDLFEWLRTSKDHLLIRSCVFHYEFEFIHPFSDGNGRMGRLWQSVILGQLSPIFAHLPIENMVYANQQAYYEAIAQSDNAGDCGVFIDFMLEEILKALKQKQGADLLQVGINVGKRVADNIGINVGINVGINEQRAIRIIAQDPKITATRLADILHVTVRQTERIFSSLRNAGIIRRVGANKNGYWEIIKEDKL